MDIHRFFESPVRRHTRLYRMPSNPSCVIRLAQDHIERRHSATARDLLIVSVGRACQSRPNTIPSSLYRANKHERHRFTIHSFHHNGCRNIPNTPVGPSGEAELEPFGATCSPTVYMTPNSGGAELDVAISSLSVPPSSFSTFHPWSE